MTHNYTLKEIAKNLNVSRGTIDRVIHNRGGISEETSNAVKEYLEAVNYKPNKMGKSLARRQDNKIFVSFHDTKNEFFKDIRLGIKAVEEEIKDYGFNIEIGEVSRNSEEQIMQIRKAIDDGANAVALAAYEPDKFVDLLDELYNKNIPVVTFNNDIINARRLCHIGINYYNNGRIAGEVMAKCIKSGSVAILRRSSSYWQNQLRITGFSEVIDSFPIIKNSGSFGGSVDYQTSYDNIKNLLIKIPDLTGILLLNNERDIITGTCDGIYDIAEHKIDIVSFDLVPACIDEIEKGRITASICQDPFSQGYYCVKVMFKYMFDKIKPEKSIYTTKLDVIYKENIDNYKKDLYRCFM